MKWIVKNEEPEPKVESYVERKARLLPIVQAASDEQLQEWLDNKEQLWDEGKHDLVTAASGELRRRNNQVGTGNYNERVWN